MRIAAGHDQFTRLGIRKHKTFGKFHHHAKDSLGLLNFQSGPDAAQIDLGLAQLQRFVPLVGNKTAMD